MAKRKKGRSSAKSPTYSVETYKRTTPGQPTLRQVVIKTQLPVLIGQESITLYRKPREPQQREINRLEPLGRGIVAGILARSDVTQIKLKRNRAYVTLGQKANFGQERDAAERIVGAQIAYFG